MNADNPVFQEFKSYWQLSEEMLARASKEDIAKPPAFWRYKPRTSPGSMASFNCQT